MTNEQNCLQKTVDFLLFASVCIAWIFFNANQLTNWWQKFDWQFIFFYHEIVFILMFTGAGGILCMLTNIPWLQVSGFLALLSCGLSTTIVNAATVELYPTSSRWEFYIYLLKWFRVFLFSSEMLNLIQVPSMWELNLSYLNCGIAHFFYHYFYYHPFLM